MARSPQKARIFLTATSEAVGLLIGGTYLLAGAYASFHDGRYPIFMPDILGFLIALFGGGAAAAYGAGFFFAFLGAFLFGAGLLVLMRRKGV